MKKNYLKNKYPRLLPRTPLVPRVLPGAPGYPRVLPSTRRVIFGIFLKTFFLKNTSGLNVFEKISFSKRIFLGKNVFWIFFENKTLFFFLKKTYFEKKFKFPVEKELFLEKILFGNKQFSGKKSFLWRPLFFKFFWNIFYWKPTSFWMLFGKNIFMKNIVQRQNLDFFAKKTCEIFLKKSFWQKIFFWIFFKSFFEIIWESYWNF